jgi:hypothetical protein
MHLWSTIAAALAMAVIVSAQTARPSPPAMVLPIAGVPLSVDSVAESIAKDAPKEISTTKYYRDAEGRMRIEMELPQPFGDPFLMIQIVDPIEGFMAVLENEAKIAHRLKMPKTAPPGRGFGIGFISPLVRVPGTKTMKTEELGKQTIEEIEFEGTRTTTTADEQPSIIAVEERWMSRELGLFGLFKHSGPDGESTARIQHADRTAPDPKLFVIPDDYRIREMTP